MPEGTQLGAAFIPIRADLDDLKKDLEQAHGNLQAKLGDFAKVAAVGAAGIGAALVGVGAAAFKIGEQFDAAFDSIRVGTGATGDALESLKDDFRAVAARVPQDFGQVGQVLADLNTRTGATGEQLQGLAKTVLDFSRVTGTDAVANVASATRMFGDWSIATEDQAGALDKIFRASQATGIGVDALMGKVVQFGAPLRAMGFSLDESAALLGKWEKEGVNGELVLGSLRIAMGKFADAGVPMREGLDQTIAKITELGPGADATSLAMEVFGARAGPDMAAAILEGRFALGELLDQVSNGTETVSGAADDTADFAEKWAQFMNQAMLAVEPLADAVFGLASTLMDRFGPAMQAGIAAVVPMVAAFADNLVPAIDNTITAFGSIFGALQPVAAFVVDQFQPIVFGLGAALTALAVIAAFEAAPAFAAWAASATAAAVSTMIALAPIVVPLAAIAAAAALLKAAWDNNWGDIQGKTQAVWDFIQPIFAGIMAALAKFWEEIEPELTATWEVISTAVGNAMKAIHQFIAPALDVLSGLWSTAWEGIKVALHVVWEAIKLYIGVVWDLLSGIIVAGLRLLRGDWQGAWDAIREHFGSAWERIKTALSGAITALSDAMRNAGPALLGLLKAGLDAAWGGVVDSVKGGVAKIGALLPHSLAEEGPLSKPTHWGDVLTGDLPATLETVTAAVSTAARKIKDDWASVATDMRLQQEAMSTTLDTVAEDVTTATTTISTAVTTLRTTLRSASGDMGDDWSSMAKILAERKQEMSGALDGLATDLTEVGDAAADAADAFEDAMARMARGQGGGAATRAVAAALGTNHDEYGNPLFYPGDVLPSGFQTLASDTVINDRGEVRVHRGNVIDFHKERVDGAANYGQDWRNDPNKNPALAAAIRLINSGQVVSTQLLRDLGLLGPNETMLNFGGGGMVPGPAGAPMMARLHGGEAVFTPDQLAVMGALLAGAGAGAGGPQVVHATFELDGQRFAQAVAPVLGPELTRASGTRIGGV